MTTTVLIGTQGNKAVTVKGPNGDVRLQPGRWFTVGIHGEQSLSVQEVGEFVDAGPATATLPKAPEGMVAFSGTKQLFAKPMTRGAYNEYRGWEIPKDEDPAETGYLVEYVDGGKANDSRHDGYISWSPASVFERSYRAI